MGSAFVLAGLVSEATGGVRIVRSRFYGGDLSSVEMPHVGSRIAAWIGGAASVEVINSTFYGGAAGVGVLAGSPNHALAIDRIEAPVIRHNTLYSGWSSYPTVGSAMFIGSVRAAVIENNVFAAANGWNEPFWMMECASKGVFETLRNNVLFNVGAPDTVNELPTLAGYGDAPKGACWAWQGFRTIDELAEHVTSVCTGETSGACSDFGGSVAGGNVTLREDCIDDSGCVPWPGCPPSEHCVSSLFAEWSAEDDGLTTMLGPGWKLAAGIPCAVAKSGLDLTMSVTDDIFGQPRTAAPSMGAHELDGACIE